MMQNLEKICIVMISMTQLIVKWLPILSWMIGGTILFPTLIIGVYRSFRHIIGLPNRLPLSGNALVEKLSAYVIAAGLGSLGVVCSLLYQAVFDQADVIYALPIIPFIGLGALLGVIFKNDFHVENFTNNKSYLNHKKFFPKAGLLIIVTGLLLQATPLALVESPGVAIIFTAPITGIYPVLFTYLGLFFGLPISRGIEKLAFSLITYSLIQVKFRKILCRYCFRYTLPLKSRYERGRRYCEHCQQEVEKTKDPGMLIFLFGIVLDKPVGTRTLLISNPDVETRKMPFDVSQVYIDTKTCNIILLERFITHILNYPPTSGLQSVQILYQGSLDNLGLNLKNALQNNFTYLQQIS